MAHGFEITEYPFWTSSRNLVDTIAGFGQHRALLVGGNENRIGRLSEKPVCCHGMYQLISGMQRCDQNSWIRQRASQQSVAGGLPTLFRMLDDMPEFPLPGIGDIITTGLWTRPFPVQPGEIWQTAVSGLPLSGLTVMFTI